MTDGDNPKCQHPNGGDGAVGAQGNLRTLLGRGFQGEAATHPRMEVRQICFRGNIQAEEIEGQR